MTDIQIAIHPAKAYTADQVIEAYEINAGYRPDRTLSDVKDALIGLEAYFKAHCREAPAKRNGG